MSLCLYVGMDDSNHAGENIKGEINLATFSLLHSDSIVEEFPNRRDYSKADRWLKHPKRDYRFTILTGDAWRGRQNNLVYTAPFLINSFLEKFSHLNIDFIKLYLDGRLDACGKIYLRGYFGDNFTVDNFIKKGRNRRGHTAKRPVCPTLVYMADILAHNVLGRSMGESFMDPRFIPFQPQQPSR